MFAEYIAAALEKAEYEIIDDPEPYYARVPGLQGVWASGKTLEECRRELICTIEELWSPEIISRPSKFYIV